MKKVSDATKRNFEKLNKSLNDHEFVSRANKRDSKKHICPVEYFSDRKNRTLIENIIESLSIYEKLPLDLIVDSLILSYLKQLLFFEH